MYEAPKVMSKQKKIELIVLVVLIIWSIIFIVNYLRFNDSKPPILSIPITRKYDDGVVKEYISLGYVYRLYERNSVSKEEFVPFWVPLENPKPTPDLPVVPTDYNVPDNIRREDKFRGLLYYFNRKGELLGTYKCINSSIDCNKAFGGYDEYDIVNKDPITAHEVKRTLGMIHEKFAFVDDSFEQESIYGDNTYVRTVYLYKFYSEDGEKPEILAKYADVKESTFDDNYNLAYGDGNKFIVKSMDNNKWGIIDIKETGTIDEVLPFEYDSINYDSDTKYYIMRKDDMWFVYDLYNKKVVSTQSKDPIYDVWCNNNLTYYFKTGIDRTIGNESFVDYKIYRIDGRVFLNVDKVTQIVERENFVMYITSTDNILHFVDYSGEEKFKLQLAFSEMHHGELTNPAFEIFFEKKGVISLRLYKGRELGSEYDTYAVNTNNWDANK